MESWKSERVRTPTLGSFILWEVGKTHVRHEREKENGEAWERTRGQSGISQKERTRPQSQEPNPWELVVKGFLENRSGCFCQASGKQSNSMGVARDLKTGCLLT